MLLFGFVFFVSAFHALSRGDVGPVWDDSQYLIQRSTGEILAHARTRLGPAVAPREIDFHPELPRTRSGKIMRRLLRARELGLPEGDLSTLERTGEPEP